MDNLEVSIKRAQRLLKTPTDSENYISLKIEPADGRCCCFHCWPQTWNEINNEISRYGYLEDEGDVAIGDKNDRFILQCHESGPEIIIYLGIGIASANLTTSVFNLILTIIKRRQEEKVGAKFKITKRVMKNNRIIKENVIEVDFPLSQENTTLLNNKIQDILKRDNY